MAAIVASAVCTSSFAQDGAEAGTYVANLPGASGCGRRILLELFSDNSYIFVQRYLCKPWSPAQTKTGSWQSDGDYLVLSSYSDEMRFFAGGERLYYVGNRYGEEGLHLQRLK